jgi:hypothetical protein
MLDATINTTYTYILLKATRTGCLFKSSAMYRQRKITMQEQQYVRQSSGAKAIAIDNRLTLAKYRLLQLLAILLGAATALGLHQIFAH